MNYPSSVTYSPESVNRDNNGTYMVGLIWRLSQYVQSSGPLCERLHHGSSENQPDLGSNHSPISTSCVIWIILTSQRAIVRINDQICVYICMCVCIHMCIYVYIYMKIENIPIILKVISKQWDWWFCLE